MSRRYWIAIGVVVAGLVAVLVVLFSAKDTDKDGKRARADRDRSERGGSDDESETQPDDPSDPDEPEAVGPAGDAELGSADPSGAPTPTPTATTTATAAAAAGTGTAAAPPSGSKKVDEMHRRVVEEAVRHNWVPVDDNDNPCPPGKIRIVYSPPSNLRQYKKGAYFEPLGPSPGDATNEVNGLLICEGYPFLYRGFEAYYRPDSGRWDVFPFPVIEE